MMSKLLRGMGGIVAALAFTIALLIAVELFSALVHPTPADFDGSMAQMCEHVANYPDWVLAVVVPMWAGIAFAATWIAARIGNQACAILIGLLLLVGLVFNVTQLPYSLWFKVAILTAIPLAIGAALLVSARPRAIPASVAG